MGKHSYVSDNTLLVIELKYLYINLELKKYIIK
jgi:hypothetical protein